MGKATLVTVDAVVEMDRIVFQFGSDTWLDLLLLVQYLNQGQRKDRYQDIPSLHGVSSLGMIALSRPKQTKSEVTHFINQNLGQCGTPKLGRKLFIILNRGSKTN